jgi:hypothetical protein
VNSCARAVSAVAAADVVSSAGDCVHAEGNFDCAVVEFALFETDNADTGFAEKSGCVHFPYCWFLDGNNQTADDVLGGAIVAPILTVALETAVAVSVGCFHAKCSC